MIIAKLLQEIEKKTGIKPTPFSTNNINNLPAINYEYCSVFNDGAKASSRLTLRITCRTLKEVYALEKLLLTSLITLGDSTLYGACIQQNGGGVIHIEGIETPQLILYFDITTKA